jgi:cyclophilin family peptidyl-prolyl cis-trans isomerase
MRQRKIGRQRVPKVRPQGKAAASHPVVEFEPLEKRELLSAGAPAIINVAADNRGTVVLTADCDLLATSVNQRSVQLFTAGPDGLLGTPDDVIQSRQVSYNDSTRQISVKADLPANTRYRLLLNSGIIRSADGAALDGEFNGAGVPSGNGVAGGDFQIFTKLPSTEEIVRFTSISGNIDVRLFRSDAPLSVANFLNYANRGVYDTTFIHRSVEDFVIQGGGFTANPQFSAIPTDPPVMNEFGRSNTRGTLAYAKFGSDPNSATSQWFFNLGNNASNLDNQNGGFTVFAEVVNARGLSVMDTLAAFEIVNAASANGAFNELPVVDADAFNARGSLAVSDLVSFSRVALLMDISGEPSQQPPLEGRVDIVNSRGDVTVRLFDMNGSGLLNATDFVDVRFGSGNSINQIRLLEPPANVRIGIQIFGAGSVGSIVDLRSSSASDIAFIVSDGSVGAVKLVQRVSGSNINGFAFPGGFLMEEDIDGDGLVSDDTSMFFAQGALSSLTAGAGLSGDVVVPGGIGAVKVRGETSGVDFDFGGDSSSSASFQLESAVDVAIRTTSALRSVSATEWINTGGVREVVQAASLGKLSISGANGAKGSFEADLNLTEDLGNLRTLGSASVKGGILRSNWNIAGHAGAIKSSALINQWSLDVAGDGQNVSAPLFAAVDLRFGGRLNSVRTADWNGGGLEADTLKSLNITGDRSSGLEGNMLGDIIIANTAQQRVALGPVRIAGNFEDTTVTVTRGDFAGLTVNGAVRGMTLRVESGDLPSASFGEVFDSSLTVFGTVRSLRATRWEGGQIGARALQSTTMTGDSSKGIAGDLFVNEIRSDHITSLNLQSGGCLTGDLFAVRADNIQITGDARDGVLSVGGSSVGSGQALSLLRVDGMMERMDLRTSNSVGSISVGSMRDSGIYVGITTISGLPDTNTGVNAQSTIDLLRIEGSRSGDFAMYNSVVVAGRLTAALVMQPQIDNFGRPFGIAAQSIGTVASKIGGTMTTLNANASPQAFGDYQIRVGFMIPA